MRGARRQSKAKQSNRARAQKQKKEGLYNSSIGTKMNQVRSSCAAIVCGTAVRMHLSHDTRRGMEQHSPYSPTRERKTMNQYSINPSRHQNRRRETAQSNTGGEDLKDGNLKSSCVTQG